MEGPSITAYISDHFEILRTLRETSVKKVLKVRSKASGKPYLVRVLFGDPSVYERLLAVRSPYLPEIFEVISDREELTREALQSAEAKRSDVSVTAGDTAAKKCTMTVLEEFIEGDQMAQMMQDCLFSAKETRKIGADLCQALYVLHGLGIVHRDIKPENIILRGSTAVLTDFDASRILKSEQSRDTVVMGTVGFAAPEQFSISQTDSRADIYAMGVLLNTMMTGEHPSARLAPGKMRRIVMRCTMISPKKRYPSIGKLMEELL